MKVYVRTYIIIAAAVAGDHLELNIITYHSFSTNCILTIEIMHIWCVYCTCVTHRCLIYNRKHAMASTNMYTQ